MTRQNKTIEFGDFQTPPSFALSICRKLCDQGVLPKTIIEPNCGKGYFMGAATRTFICAEIFMGFDINSQYVAAANQYLSEITTKTFQIVTADFFTTNWTKLISNLPKPILFIGNPPWVTNSALGSLSGSNLPDKTNVFGLSGLAALTGKSNFDISEWMISRLLESIQKTEGVVAMLCKTSVARKIVHIARLKGMDFLDAALFHIDAKEIFNVSVDACLFTFSSCHNKKQYTCKVYSSLDAQTPSGEFGYVGDNFVSDISRYTRKFDALGLSSPGQKFKWRSGVKHDCSAVMELSCEGGVLTNAMGEVINVEDDFLYPLIKSSDLNRDTVVLGRKQIIVTQKFIGENTLRLKSEAPKLWRYLLKHTDLFERRRSSIYRNRPLFSIFGVGDYSFSSWKIAISGFYKNLKFVLVPPHQGKPVIFDDTCYFLPFANEQSARLVFDLLNSDPSRSFFESIIFWDAKRPINSEILQRVNLFEIARSKGADLRDYSELFYQYHHPLLDDGLFR